MSDYVEGNDEIYKRDQASKWTKARKGDKREGGDNKRQKKEYVNE